MKAAYRAQYGDVSSIELKEVKKPILNKGEVLIEVHYTTVNRTDEGVLTGKPYIFRLFIGLFKPSRPVLGTDFCGVVKEKASDVKEFEVGDKVWGFNDEGLSSQAEFMKIKASKAILKLPENTSMINAVASAEGFHYAINFIKSVQLNEGDVVLVNGATGAIGSTMIQQLVYKKIIVDAVGDSAHRDKVLSYGVRNYYDYQKEDFTTVVTDNYKCVFDAVGKSRFKKCKPILQRGGRYLSSELGPGAENTYLPLFTMFSKKKVVFPFPKNVKKSLEFAETLLKDNALNPMIEKHYSLSEVQQAYSHMRSGNKKGNIILTIKGE